MFKWFKNKFFSPPKKNPITRSLSNLEIEDDRNIYKFKLNSYSEVVYVAKILIKKGKVLIHLDELEKNERRRILDFLSGVIFFQEEGKVKRIKDHIYLFTIENKVQ